MRIKQTKISTVRKSLLAIVPVFAALSLVVAVSGTYAAKPAETGFNEFGYNYNARIYKNFYPSYPDAYLKMKWSKDWDPMANQPVGAWTTNNWTWYSDDYDEASWYGWDTMNSFGSGAYRVEDFSKIQSVGDDMDAWLEYQAGGAYSAGWGSYASGVPRYVVFQDVVTVYDAATNEMVAEYNLMTAGPKGLGKPIF